MKEAGFLSGERGEGHCEGDHAPKKSQVLRGPTPGNEILLSATFSATFISITVDRTERRRSGASLKLGLPSLKAEHFLLIHSHLLRNHRGARKHGL